MAIKSKRTPEELAEAKAAQSRKQADRLFGLCGGCNRERRLVTPDGTEFRPHRRYVAYEIRQGLADLPGHMEPCLPEPVAAHWPAFIGEGAE